MAETLDQWYDMLQETYDKWSQEIERLEKEFETTEDEKLQLNKKIKNILPTLERYKYYLDYRHKPSQDDEIQITENVTERAPEGIDWEQMFSF